MGCFLAGLRTECRHIFDILQFLQTHRIQHVVSTSVLVGRGIVVVVVVVAAAAAAVFFPNGQFPWQIFRNDSDC